MWFLPGNGWNRIGNHSYPYETPAGVEAFLGHISIHTKPLPGQRLFGATYLSIRNPCRGRGFFGATYLSIRSPCRGKGFFGATYLSIGNPCRGKGFFGPHIYPYETPAGVEAFGIHFSSPNNPSAKISQRDAFGMCVPRNYPLLKFQHYWIIELLHYWIKQFVITKYPLVFFEINVEI